MSAITSQPEEAAHTRNQFTIPVYPHVKKFILKKYRLREPVITEEYSSFGKSVTLALKDNRLRIDYNDSQFRDRLKKSLKVVLTKEQMEFGPRLQKLIRINHAMDDAFKEHLITWVQAQFASGVPAYAACKMFLEFYRIDEKEYSLDAAYKLWQRAKLKEVA